VTTETPCSTGDPEDWFLEKDGKQYRDDPILTSDECDALWDTVDPNLSAEEVDRIVDEAEAEKIRLALIRRRKARDACYDCEIRLGCLNQRLEQRVEYGIWGGYYPEELRKIEEELDRRAVGRQA
jgi:Transcription factor WhiB